MDKFKQKPSLELCLLSNERRKRVDLVGRGRADGEWRIGRETRIQNK